MDVNFVGRTGYGFQLFYEETDRNLPQNEKLAMVIADGGVYPYGVFWGLVEILASKKFEIVADEYGNKIPRFQPYSYPRAVRQLAGWNEDEEDLGPHKKQVNLAVMLLVQHDVLDYYSFIDGQLSLSSDRVLVLFDYTTTPAPVRDYRQYASEIYDRDGHQCVYCGSPHNLSLDHFIPQSKGGSHDKSNLVTACRSCNSSKGDRLFGEWLKARNFSVQ